MTGLGSRVVAGVVDVGVAKNANPPSRGTEALEVVDGEVAEFVTVEKLNVTLREDGVFDAALDSGVTLCEVVTVGARMIGGDGTVDTDTMGGAALATSSLLVCGASFGSTLETFDGSLVFATGLAAATVDGTFKRDVVVAVLNVTEVVVLKLADVEATISFGFSAWPDFSLSLELALTLSTSSLGSSPRKKLNIMASFDSLSRFRNMLVVFVFGFTNDIEFSSSSSTNVFLLLDDCTLL